MAECKTRKDVVSFLLCSASFSHQYTFPIYLGGFNYLNSKLTTKSLPPGTYQKNLNSYAVMDAVYAFAHALRAWHTHLCPGTKKLCDKLKDAQVDQIMGYLKKVNFTGKFS